MMMKQTTAMQMQESATLKAGQGCSERNVQIEEQKIDHVTVEETIGQISKDAGQEQSERNIAPGSRGVRRRRRETTKTSATQESTMKKRLLFWKEPKAAPVFVTCTR